MNKLSRKNIEMLEMLATTPELEGKLAEYVAAEKVVSKLWKEFREAVVNGKAVEPIGAKRKFKAGDKVRVISVEEDVATMTGLSVGDVTEVIAYKDDSPEEYWFISRRPVIVTGGHGHRGYFEESALELVEEKSPNELRAEIIQRAKDFVSKNSNENHVISEVETKFKIRFTGFPVTDVLNFVVNDKKRTVVALIKGINTGALYARGIAKCHPDDVFNEHIGKAISLGRALSKDVSEFENAVQPNEIVVGHSISSTRKDGSYYEYPSVTEVEEGKVWSGFSFTLIEGLATRPKITDDTNAIYEEEM